MIRSPTVLVLGAGASHPYGLPLGRTLIRDIVHLTGSNNDDFLDYVGRNGIGRPHDALMFSGLLRSANQPSIDKFLFYYQQKPELKTLVNIGKHAIAWQICHAEDPRKLDLYHEVDKEGRPVENWYAYLWGRISDNFAAGSQNLLHIVTFNYDRSLERFILDASMATFHWSPDHACEELRKLPITHVYGSVGDIYSRLPSGEHNPEYRQYAPPVRFSSDVARAASRIRVIGDRGHPEEIASLKRVFREAHRSCFLGFAYDDKNLETIGFGSEWVESRGPHSSSSVYICGTTVGLLEGEITAARRYLGSNFDACNATCEPSLKHFGVLL